MILSTALIAGISGLALGFVYNITEPKISAAKKAKEELAIKKVLPPFDFKEDGIYEIKEIDGQDTIKTSYAYSVAYKTDSTTSKKDLVGVAINTYSMNGFSGEVRLMAGILPDGTLNKVSVLLCKETPGLGTKMNDSSFYKQFEGKNPASFKFQVTKDGGNVDAITSATISSRAYCDALDRAFRVFNQIVSTK